MATLLPACGDDTSGVSGEGSSTADVEPTSTGVDPTTTGGETETPTTTGIDPDTGSSSTGNDTDPTGVDGSSSSTGAPNVEPEAFDDFYVTNTLADPFDVAADAGLLGNDMDEDADPLSVVDSDDASEAGGTVDVQPDGSFSYTPPSPFWGEDAFSYTIDDGAGGMATARVRVVVAPVAEDLGDLSDATAGYRVEPATSGDHIAVSVAGGGDINGDGLADVVMGADDALGDARGAAYVVFGDPDAATISAADIENGTDGFVVLGPVAANSTGYSVTVLGDMNGDGLADLAVGTSDGSGISEDVYVVFGKADTAAVDLDAIGTGGFVISGGDISFGTSVADAGDVNGDGLADIIIGRPESGDNEQGDAVVVFGKADSDPIDASGSLGEAGFLIVGEPANGHVGAAVAGAGDINGDGLDDLIVGSPDSGAGGRVFVVHGRTETTPVTEANLIAGEGGFLVGAALPGDFTGISVAGIGDCNGDGRDDMAFGANGAEVPDATATGRAYVLFGTNATAGVNVSDLALGQGGFALEGESDFDQAGWSVGGAGDVNGDGLSDVLVGAQGADFGGGTAGRTYVVFGDPAGATRPLSEIATGVGGYALDGDGLLQTAGWTVDGAGDANGDGFSDVVIGAPRAMSASGWGYVSFGGNWTGEAVLPWTSADDVIVGTADAETLVGGLGNDEIQTGGGADVVRGGAGDDVVAIAATDFFRIDGGLGTDTLRVLGSGVSLDLSNFFQVALVDFEVIDLTGDGDNSLFLDARHVRDLSSHSNTVLVRGDAGDQVVSDLTGTAMTDMGSDGVVTTYSNGVLTLLVEDAVTPFVSLD